jgi:acyl-CoA synthetase (AMP-forming)/AMP-acid ligase II
MVEAAAREDPDRIQFIDIESGYFLLFNLKIISGQMTDHSIMKILHCSYFHYIGESTTIGDLDKLANQVAEFCESVKLKENDTAALMMTNSADFVAIWLGVAKIGASTALINTNNRGASLLHSLTSALEGTESKVFIVEEALRNHVLEDLDSILAMGIQVFFWNCSIENDSNYNLKATVVQLSSSKRHRKLSVKASDPIIYIYTSGTTGNWSMYAYVSSNE